MHRRAVTERIAHLPVQTWANKDDAHTEHLDPVAQDSYAAFAVGPDDKHVTTVDESGVALAAIQGVESETDRGIAAPGHGERGVEGVVGAVGATPQRQERRWSVKTPCMRLRLNHAAPQKQCQTSKTHLLTLVVSAPLRIGCRDAAKTNRRSYGWFWPSSLGGHRLEHACSQANRDRWDRPAEK